MKNTKPKRKPIVKKGWAVKWQGGRIEFFRTHRMAYNEMEQHHYNKAVLFRCEIREIL